MTFIKIVLKTVISMFNNNDIDILSGNAFSFRDSGNKITITNRYKNIISSDGFLRLERLLFGIPAINALFFKKKILEDVKYFDTSYKFSSDRDLLIRLYLANSKCQHIDKDFYCYREHPGSMTLANNYVTRSEIGKEHMEMAARLIQSGLANKLYMEWYYSSSLTLLYGLIRSYKFIVCIPVIRKECRENKYWPIHFCKAILNKFIKKY
jgi:hypothetical protein